MMFKYLLLVFLCIALCDQVEACVSSELEVKASLAGAGPISALNFSVTNTSNREITLFKSDLPWGNLYSATIILLLPNRGQTEVPKALYSDDPGPTQITIKGGEKLDGSIALKELFPDLTKLSRDSDVLVFWSYKLRNARYECVNRVGGMLVIEKQ